jgi:hypothetical protein
MEDDREKDKDVVFLHSPTEDGEGAHVLRARRGNLETGEVRPLKEGKAVGVGEIVALHPRPDAPRVCDVTVAYAPPKRGSSGPAQVASRAYRDEWERIFGAKPKGAGAPN